MSHNHTRFRNGDGPWSVCPPTCPESTSIMGELYRLRAVVARVEELADKWEADAQRADDAEPVNIEGLTRMILSARYLRMTASDLRTVLGSTDSDPAATERYAAAEGAGDGV